MVTKQQRLKDITLTILILIFAFILILSLGAILHTTVPLAVVSSWSMEPVLHVGDIVIVSGSSSYSVGDIVVYDNGRNLIVHRIVGVQGSHYITKGDANSFPDNFRPSIKDVKGKVIVVIPYLGSIKLFFEKLAKI